MAREQIPEPIPRTGRLRRRLVSTAVLAVSAVLALAAGPVGATAHSNADRVDGTIGHLTVSDAFLPAPASPAVAAIYLTVTNRSAHADALVSVSSSAADSAMLMTENADGTMGMLRELKIPAHGRASLVPGRDHLMLEQPRRDFGVGEQVSVTLHFAKAGSLTISVPVVPLSWILHR